MEENNEDQLNQQIRARLTDPQNYINFGHSNGVIGKSLKIIEKNIIEIEEKEFESTNISQSVGGKGEAMLAEYEKKFYVNFHRDFMGTLE